MLLEFGETLKYKPVHPADISSHTEPEGELRQIRRRKGRRALASFENLPVIMHVYELNAAERDCPGCGVARKEIGMEESWQIEYVPGHFERIHHIRKKYACTACELIGESPQIKTANKPEAAIDKGLAGPGLLASKQILRLRTTVSSGRHLCTPGL